MTVRVAAVQARPTFLDSAATLRDTLGWIERARDEGAQLVAFPETWFPGYPAWLDISPEAGYWDHAPVKQTFARLRENAVTIPGPIVDAVADAASRCDLTVVLGVHEKVETGPGNRTLYNTVITIGSDGRVLNRHRKLVPTYTERLVWGQGDGAGLCAVPTAVGRVGALICWEHWMPVVRHVMHVSGEDIHIAQWPTVHEMHQVASRQYAFEARCFVVAVGGILKAGDLPPEVPVPSSHAPSAEDNVLHGGSAIIAPDGRYVAGPVFDEETILVADLDLSEIDEGAMNLDVTGHYHRPDLFDVQVRLPD